MSSSRLRSIDIFRGLTILTMVFVNDLASVRDIPWWMKHMPEDRSGLTFVDVVFPAFLFIVGMAIPFALERRLNRGDSLWSVWRHILVRTAGLLVLGVMMVNIHDLNAIASGMSRSWWSLLLFVGAILLWNIYPADSARRRIIGHGLRGVGAGLLVYLALVYRGGVSGSEHWLLTSWWGILGLIGWAYLTCAALYLAFRRHLAAVAGSIGLLVLLYVADKTGALDGLQSIRQFLWLGGQIGGHGSITAAGMLAAMILREGSAAHTVHARLRALLILSFFLALGGLFLEPLYGVNKVAATPAWCLYCSAISVLIITALYWIVDIRGWSRWADFVGPAGRDPLLAYILPDMYYALLGITGLSFAGTALGAGIPGIARSLVTALATLFLTHRITKSGLHLRF